MNITSNEDIITNIFELVNGNEIRVRNSTLLDYEISRRYVITVEATDRGTPPL